MKNKCEHCNRNADYKVSSFHSTYDCLFKPNQKDRLPTPGKVEMVIGYCCGHCLPGPKEPYKTDYCYVFVEKL